MNRKSPNRGSPTYPNQGNSNIGIGSNRVKYQKPDTTRQTFNQTSTSALSNSHSTP